ncbi:MAG: glycosyltransferase [Bacteroidota bacterium]
MSTALPSPVLSVVVITYNQEKYIAQALDSILHQKCSYAYEVIVGEDCSIDATGDIVKEYAKNHPDKVFLSLNEKNNGAIANEKKCIEKAKGKYICFLEGDDYWMDELKLQKQIDFLEANPDYGLVHADVDHYYEATGKTEHHVNRSNHVKVPEGAIFNDLMKPDPFFIKPATVCFRKELVRQYFDYDLAIKENWPLTDFPLWLDIAFHSKVHYIDEVFATYRLLNESASRTQSPKKKLRFHNGLYHIKQTYIAKYKASDAIKLAIDENYYRVLLKIAYNLGDGLLAQKAINYFKTHGLNINLNEKLLALGAEHKPVKSILNFIRNKA